MKNRQIVEELFLNESVDLLLKRLEPYKPTKLILGKHFIPKGRDWLLLNSEVYTYRGIPVEESEDKYKIDFEL